LLITILAAAVPAHARDTLKRTNIQRYYNPVKLELLGAASVMPADKYGFKDREGAGRVVRLLRRGVREAQRDLRQHRRLPAREPHPPAVHGDDAGDAEGNKTAAEVMKEMMESTPGNRRV
jgi:hypothetical protein